MSESHAITPERVLAAFEKAGYHFVSRSSGRCTTNTVSLDDLISVARELSAAPPVQAPSDDVIGLAQALEQQRALKIVDDVHNLPFGGREALMPTAFQAGYCAACEEIEHRLRTEEWELCLPPVGTAPVAATVAGTEALIAACVPGGGLCDPQKVADAIRAYRGATVAAPPAKEVPLNIIRWWPDGFQARLDHIWKDVDGLIPNYKLYDLQRVLAEFGFTMKVYEAAAAPAAPPTANAPLVAVNECAVCRGTGLELEGGTYPDFLSCLICEGTGTVAAPEQWPEGWDGRDREAFSRSLNATRRRYTAPVAPSPSVPYGEWAELIYGAPPAPQAAAEDASPRVQLGPVAFAFSGFQQWVNKAQGWFASRIPPESRGRYLALDAAGRVCLIGRDFMRARDEGTFPVTVYLVDAPTEVT